jgi:C2HE / C2H2 / C2HC zinc-binding finger
MSALPKTQYEPILSSPLSCWRCGRTAKNIPTLKQHLQEEWGIEKERAKKRAKARGDKRKRDEEVSAKEMEEIEPAPKRVQKGSPSDKLLDAIEIDN